MYENIALVGATGAVGTIVRQLLEERDVPFKSIRFIASKRSAGTKLTFKGEEYTVVELGPDAFDGMDLIIASTPDEVAAELVPWAKAAGAVVVDESGFHRMLPNVPLVVPEVNPEAINGYKSKNIIKERQIGKIKIREQLLKDFPPKELRGIIDQGKKEIESGIIICISTFEDKVGVAVGVSKDLTSKYDAVNLVKIASKTLGGKGGGGRKDFAQAGGVDKDKVEKAFKEISKTIN